MSGTHSILAPSFADTWARCVGAPHLSRGLPDVDKEYNASGTCSHWILEQDLKGIAKAESWLGKEMEFGGFKFVIDEDRIERVQQTVQAIGREPGQMWVEKKLNTSPVFGVPGQEGHADIVKLDMLGSVEVDGKPLQGVLTVHDFKDGYLLVKAKDNLQGLSYLAAALYEFDLIAPINALRFCIHQPKIHNYDEWTYTREEIEHFTSIIRPAAKLAYDIYHGNVEFNPAQHLNAGETQCFWCPVRGSCPARAKRIVDMFAPLIQKHELDDPTLSQIYMSLDEIEQACRDFRGEALKRALAGRTIDGQKLVKGKRGKRYWTVDQAHVEAALETAALKKGGIPLDSIYEPRVVISPTAAEKLLKKEVYADVAKIVDQKDGSLSLAPLDDKREAVTFQQFPLVTNQTSNSEDLA
jgi:hypothetical protein